MLVILRIHVLGFSACAIKSRSLLASKSSLSKTIALPHNSEIQQTRLILAENKPVALDLPISAPAIQLQVSGHIFMDHNANGVWDGEEPVMRSWEMALTHEIIPGAPKTITQSPAAADGYYAFMPEVLAMHHFRPGTYVGRLRACAHATTAGGEGAPKSVKTSQQNANMCT